ncbi:MAG: serine hydrolase domain-containing protein [Rhodothermales bacterium]
MFVRNLLRYLLVFGMALPAAAQAPLLGTRVQQIVAELEPLIEQALIDGQIPSATIALVEGDRILWTGAYGYSNLWARTPAVPSTVYLIGSTFKGLSTAALLQLRDAGAFSLDDPVRSYIEPLEIAGEDFKNPVTFRHLLTHTSGLPVAFDGYPVWGDTAPPALEDYLKTALAVEAPPLTRVEYSNLAYSLVAYIIEKQARMPYGAYMQQRIFDPLEMTSTAFIPTPEMTERLAIPYEIDESTNRPAPTTRLKASVWPAGIVYGTVVDQAHWLIANLNDGVYKGRQIIAKKSLDEMMTRQYDRFKGPVAELWGTAEAGYGLTWWTDRRDGETYFAHSGSVPGYTAFLQGNRDRRIGFAILTNGHRAHPYLIRLADEAMALMRKYPPEASPSSSDR